MILVRRRGGGGMFKNDRLLSDIATASQNLQIGYQKSSDCFCKHVFGS